MTDGNHTIPQRIQRHALWAAFDRAEADRLRRLAEGPRPLPPPPVAAVDAVDIDAHEAALPATVLLRMADEADARARGRDRMIEALTTQLRRNRR